MRVQKKDELIAGMLVGLPDVQRQMAYTLGELKAIDENKIAFWCQRAARAACRK